MEKIITPEQEGRDALFERLWESALQGDGLIEFQGPYPVYQFLEYLVREKNVLIHGSTAETDGELEPRQANCRSKRFGNLNAVYATEDPILPIFHAVFDKTAFDSGFLRSGYDVTANDDGGTLKHYKFSLPAQAASPQPWADGVIYLLPRNQFEQGVDDTGQPIDEFVSRTPIKPLAKLRVTPGDFPFLEGVEPLEEAA